MDRDTTDVGRTVNEICEQTLQISRRSNFGPWSVEIGNSNTTTRSILHPGERLVVGSVRDADIRVADPCVSARHCVLDASGEGLRIVDLGSRNGLYVGNARVRSARLESQCLAFVIGKTTIVIRCSNGRDSEGAAEPIPGMIGSSEPMIRVANAIRMHAPKRAPILVVGESGVGKDVAARAIHHLSGRTGDYHPINVSTIPESLADSELFGHLRGAFTGALTNRSGAFAMAHKGTILLDEIGELPLPIQAKLLRIVEDGVVRPVGGAQIQTVDVRIVSATWVPLIERVFQGRFRFDLLQRLSTVVIEIPPLRKRKSDIPALVAHWAQRQESELGPRIFTSAAIARLVAHDWSGNVRELAAVLYRACVGAEGIEVDWHNIDEGLRDGISNSTSSQADPQDLLGRCEGNVSMAARAAGLPRSTFRSRLTRSSGNT